MNQYKNNILTGDDKEVIDNITETLLNNKKMMLITANSECFVHAADNPELQEIMLSEDTKIVVDGIAALKAFEYLGNDNIVKIPGVDIVEILLGVANQNKLKLAVLGGTPESNTNFAKYVNNDFPGVDLVESVDGYINDKDSIMESFSTKEPDIILVGLGVPAQELLIGKNIGKFNKGIFIGCGGSLDVLGKTKKRAPKFFRITSTEWLYRILREPNRMGRFFRTNINFYKMARESKKHEI